MKRFGLIALIVLALVVVAGCGGSTDSDVASHNISKEAEQFKVPRRIVFYNGITDKIAQTVEGFCSIEEDEGVTKTQLEVTCKVQNEETEKSEYYKEYLGLSDNMTYMVQQLEPLAVSTSHYKVIIKPSTVIPDIEIP